MIEKVHEGCGVLVLVVMEGVDEVVKVVVKVAVDIVVCAGAYSEPYAPLPGRNNRSCIYEV